MKSASPSVSALAMALAKLLQSIDLARGEFCAHSLMRDVPFLISVGTSSGKLARSRARATAVFIGTRANGSANENGRDELQRAYASGIAAARRASTVRSMSSVMSIKVSYVAYAR